jgi:hypothetical protein
MMGDFCRTAVCEASYYVGQETQITRRVESIWGKARRFRANSPPPLFFLSRIEDIMQYDIAGHGGMC